MNLFYEYFGRFSGEGNLAFLSLVGAIALVVGGIPAMMMQKPDGSTSAKHFLTRLAIFFYGIIGIFSAAFILAPLYSTNSGLMIVISLFFAAMFLFRLAMASPNTPLKAWALILSPLLFSFLAYFFSNHLNFADKIKFFPLTIFSQFLNSGLIIYAGFWLSWPLMFFAITKNGGENLKNNLKNNTILTLVGLLFIVAIWFAGLYYSFQGALHLFSFASTFSLLFLLGVVVQVFNESRAILQSYRKGIK